jgi:NADH:ubiquinone oxidoreductase subunit F (NADH-binding)
MEQTSICGLGQFVPYPITTALKHFREEVEAHVLHRVCPAGVCSMGA